MFPQQQQAPTNALNQNPSPQGLAQPDPSIDYWANKKGAELVGELQGQERGWWAAGVRRGYWHLLRLMYAQTQGMDPGGAVNATQQMRVVGPNASFVRFRVQLTRSHIKQRNITAAGERISYQCLALNNDSKSMGQVKACQQGLDYIARDAKAESKEWEALGADGYFGEGFVWGRWDPTQGRDVDYMADEPVLDELGQPMVWPEDGSPQGGTPVTQPVKKKKKAGKPTLTSLFPWDVVKDPYAKGDISDLPWVMVREVISKHSVAARYPELADKILPINNLRSEAGIAEMFAYDMGAITTDQIIVRHFYHRKSPECPNGRYVGIAGEVILWDEPCPLPEGLPIYSVCSARYIGTLFGYPECSDLLALQEMIDECLTQAANNILRYGNQSLWAEDGVEVDMKSLARGGGFFNYKTGQKPPQTIQWAELPEATKYVLEFLLARMGEISGMNNTSRGMPDANIQSGTFAALMLNVAQKFVSATEQSLDALRNGVGNMLLQFLHANADTEFMATVSGANNQPYLKLFKGEEFSGIQRVQVSTTNALLRTIPGRFEVLKEIKDMTKPDRSAAVQLLTTGDSSAFCEDDMSCMILIQRENELLSQGIYCLPAQSDDPILHNAKHKAAYDRLRSMEVDPEDVEAVQVRQAALMAFQQHMSGHALEWLQADPVMLDSLGIPRPALPMNPYGTTPIAGIDKATGNPAGMAAPPQAGPPAPPDGGGEGPGGPGAGPGTPEPAAPPDGAMNQPAAQVAA